jgi:hypothetical protein
MSLYAAHHDQTRSTSTGAFPRFRSLELVVADRRRYPPMAWGSVNPVQRAQPPAVTGPIAARSPIPTSAGPARLDIMFAYDARASVQPYIWAIDLHSDTAAAVFAYGNSVSSGSPHWFDQAPLFAAGQLRNIAGSSAATGGTAYRPGAARPAAIDVAH